MARTALSKITTYGTMVTNARNESRVTTTGFSLLTDAYLYKIISLIVQRFALVLTNNERPFYRDKELIAYALTAPYYVDTSSLNPYWNNAVRLAHTTSLSVRIPITVLNPSNTEVLARLTTVESSSILALQLGWGFRLFFGSSITIDNTNDRIEFTFDGQPIVSGAVSGTYLDVPDSLVPFVKEELVEYILKYVGRLDAQTFYQNKTERLKRLLNA